MLDIKSNTLSIDNKPVKWMTINGRIAYTTSPNNTYSLLALESTTLSAAGVLGQVSYTPPGDSAIYTCDVYGTASEAWWGAGSGSTQLFPVSPHVFARAQHYNSTLTSFWCRQSFTTSSQENLAAWAKENGFDSDYVDSLGIGDIELVTTSTELTAFTTDDIPYYMSETAFKGLYWRDTFKGLAGWCGTQLTSYSQKPQPVIFTDKVSSGETAGELKWSTPQLLADLVPDGEQYAYLKSVGATYLGTTGDSGKPVYLKVGGGKNIVVSHNH